MSASDTPRTDAFYSSAACAEIFAGIEHARTLERELAEAKADLESIRFLTVPRAEHDQLRAEVERLQTIMDSMRKNNHKTVGCLMGWQKHAQRMGKILGCWSVTDDIEKATDTLRARVAELEATTYTLENGSTVTGERAARLLDDEHREHKDTTAYWMAKNKELVADKARLIDALASEYNQVAPLVADFPVELWEHLGDGYCKGKWAEDGSPYQFKVPEQLVPSFFALQRLARLCKDQHDAAMKEEKS